MKYPLYVVFTLVLVVVMRPVEVWAGQVNNVDVQVAAVADAAITVSNAEANYDNATLLVALADQAMKSRDTAVSDAVLTVQVAFEAKMKADKALVAAKAAPAKPRSAEEEAAAARALVPLTTAATNAERAYQAALAALPNANVKAKVEIWMQARNAQDRAMDNVQYAIKRLSFHNELLDAAIKGK